jgi:hypothetical protein
LADWDSASNDLAIGITADRWDKTGTTMNKQIVFGE